LQSISEVNEKMPDEFLHKDREESKPY